MFVVFSLDKYHSANELGILTSFQINALPKISNTLSLLVLS
jgi:hypothetical protein